MFYIDISSDCDSLSHSPWQRHKRCSWTHQLWKCSPFFERARGFFTVYVGGGGEFLRFSRYSARKTLFNSVLKVYALLREHSVMEMVWKNWAIRKKGKSRHFFSHMNVCWHEQICYNRSVLILLSTVLYTELSLVFNTQHKNPGSLTKCLRFRTQRKRRAPHNKMYYYNCYDRKKGARK